MVWKTQCQEITILHVKKKRTSWGQTKIGVYFETGSSCGAQDGIKRSVLLALPVVVIGLSLVGKTVSKVSFHYSVIFTWSEWSYKVQMKSSHSLLYD